MQCALTFAMMENVFETSPHHTNTTCVLNALSYTADLLNCLMIYALTKLSSLPRPFKTLLLSLAVLIWVLVWWCSLRTLWLLQGNVPTNWNSWIDYWLFTTWRIYCARLDAILFIVTVFHSPTTTTIRSFNLYICIYVYVFIYSTYFALLRRFIYYSLRVYSLFYFKYCLFCVYIYIYIYIHKFICF